MKSEDHLSLSFDFGDVRLSHRRHVGLHKQYSYNMRSFLLSCIIHISRHFSCLPLKRPVANSAIGERVRVIFITCRKTSEPLNVFIKYSTPFRTVKSHWCLCTVCVCLNHFLLQRSETLKCLFLQSQTLKVPPRYCIFHSLFIYAKSKEFLTNVDPP